MASISSTSLSNLPLERLVLYHATDPILSSVLVFYGPVITANSTISSSRVQAYIITPCGVQCYPRVTISPTAPIYASVHHLPREKQGDETSRGLATCLLKFFGDLPETIKDELLVVLRCERQLPQSTNIFEETHAAGIADRMSMIENPTNIIRGLRDGFRDRVVSWIDVDLVLPAGSISVIDPGRDSIFGAELKDILPKRYGQFSSLVGCLGDPVFLPTSKLRRAPSKPTNTSKSRIFGAGKKEALRLSMCELVETEERYVEKMHNLVYSIVNDFKSKARDHQGTSTSPDEKSLVRLFPPCLNEIFEVNNAFLQQIQSVLEQTDKGALSDLQKDTVLDPSSLRRDLSGKRLDATGILQLSQVLFEWFPRFSSPYGSYMRAHHTFTQTLNTFLNDQGSSFSRRVYDTGEKRIRSLLMEPIQRLPRYSLLIDSMTSSLPAVHPAVKFLLKARDVISEICSLDSEFAYDHSSSLRRLQNLVPNYPISHLPSGRLVTTVDVYQLSPPYRLVSSGDHHEPGIMLVYADYIILLTKPETSKLTARGVLTDLEKPVMEANAESQSSEYLDFSRAFPITDIRFTQSTDGYILYLTPTTQFLQKVCSRSTATLIAVQLASTYEGKATKLIEELTKARIESRFPEKLRESGKWALHSVKGVDGKTNFLVSLFEDKTDPRISPKKPAMAKIQVSQTSVPKLKDLNRQDTEVCGSMSFTMTGRCKMVLDTVVGMSFSDTFAPHEFISVLSHRVGHLLRPLNQPQNPFLVSTILNSNFNILRSITGHLLGPVKISKGLKTPSPTKLFSSIWSGSQLKTPSKQVVEDGPLVNSPALEHPKTIQLPTKQGTRTEISSGPTLFEVDSADKKQHQFHALEQTLTAYILALRSRSGNIIGRVLQTRHQANTVEVNELYNILIEDAGKIQAAAEVSIDVLFMSFETFITKAWKEQFGPIISPELLQAIQSKFDQHSPGDFDHCFRQCLSGLGPQNHRALTALIKLLAELLDASGNDGDRGALTATFAEILTNSGDPREHISLLDRLVEDFDRILEGHVENIPPTEKIFPHETFGMGARPQSVTAGSVNSNTSSIRKKLGFGLSRENSTRSEHESKVSSIIRTLSKSKGSGDLSSQSPSVSKGMPFRTQFTDIDHRANGYLRPSSRDKFYPGLFLGENQSLRPSSAHSNAPPLASIGEDLIVEKPKIKKKRRSSLSDLESLRSPTVTPDKYPAGIRHPLLSSPGTGRLSPGSEPPTRQSRSIRRTGIEQQPSTSPIRGEFPFKQSGYKTNENEPPSRSASPAKGTARKDTVRTSPKSSKKRTEHQSRSIAEPPSSLRDLTNKSEENVKTPSSALSQRPQRLRMQNPQKLRERLQNEKKAMATTDTALKAELASVSDELNESRSLSSNKGLSTPPRNDNTLLGRIHALESKVFSMSDDFNSRVLILEQDINSSLLVSEGRAKRLDELYREASAENSALYDRFNEELSKISKDIKLGQGDTALKNQLKTALDEVERVKKENFRLRREIGGLRAQHYDGFLMD